MTNEEQIQVKAASILDKTDWRKTIHKKLEECVNMEGTKPGYRNAVKKLISATTAKYPGFNAKKIINNEIIKIKKTHNEIANEWIEENPEQWAYPWVQWEKEAEWELDLYKDVFEFIKDLLAKRRILLYGVRKTPGGTQMPDEE